jgi:hypothetical protein
MDGFIFCTSLVRRLNDEYLSNSEQFFLKIKNFLIISNFYGQGKKKKVGDVGQLTVNTHFFGPI